MLLGATKTAPVRGWPAFDLVGGHQTGYLCRPQGADASAKYVLSVRQGSEESTTIRADILPKYQAFIVRIVR